MRGRNTERLTLELGNKMANYQGRWHVIMKFIHEEKHIVFSDTGKGRRKMEVLEGVRIAVAIIG